MDSNLSEQVQMLNPWFYDLSIGQMKVLPGIGSPHTSEQLVADTRYKHRILVDAIVDKYDFKGKSLLDIASNCGYWSSHYAQHGAVSLLAVEGRKQFIAQGNLYWQHGHFMPLNNYRFLLGNINSDQTWQVIMDKSPFDFVLCCGILYHIHDHRTLLQRIASVVREAVLIDTRICDPKTINAGPFVEVGDWKFDGIDRHDGQKALAAHPTIDLLRNFFLDRNYDVEMIRASIPVHRLMYPKDNYDLYKRITLLCRRK